ncbi:MAG: hypothetical protein WBD16_03075 [Pyrinomonadaceae bacterium]
MRKFLFFTLLFFAVLAIPEFSQDTGRADFSGDWRLNLSESKVSKGASRDLLQLSASTILRILHKAPEFTASTIKPDTGAVTTQTTYYTDGREKKTDNGLSIEKTKWEGKKLVTQIKPSVNEQDRVGSRGSDRKILIGTGSVKRELRFEWELLPNGKLIQKVRITDRSETQILNRREIKEDKIEIVRVFDRIKP